MKTKHPIKFNIKDMLVKMNQNAEWGVVYSYWGNINDGYIIIISGRNYYKFCNWYSNLNFINQPQESRIKLLKYLK